MYVLSCQKLHLFHKVVCDVLGEVDKFVIAYAKFIQNFVYKNYQDRLILEGVIQKIREGCFLTRGVDW